MGDPRARTNSNTNTDVEWLGRATEGSSVIIHALLRQEMMREAQVWGEKYMGNLYTFLSVLLILKFL